MTNILRGLLGKGKPKPFGLVDRLGKQIADIVASMPTTELDHYLIHMGVSFLHSDEHTVASGGGTFEFIIQTDADTEVHLAHIHVTSTQGAGKLQLFRGVTSDDLGTPEEMLNKNHLSDKTSVLSCGHTPTNVSVAAVPKPLETWLVTGGKHSGGETSAGHDEYVLAQNEKYLLRFTNNSGGTADVITIDVGSLEIGQLA